MIWPARTLRELDTIPRGYAVAWVQPWRMTAVVLPFGLHAIASTLRTWWLAARVWYRPDVVTLAFERGRTAGRADAQDAFQLVKADITQQAADARRAAFREGYTHCLAVLMANIDHTPAPAPPSWVTHG